MNRIAVVVLNFNGWDDTRLCLRSLEPLDATVILVDNASNVNRLVEMQREFPRIQTIRNEVNGGWAGGNNVGIRAALEQGFDAVLLLNNDTTVSPRLFEVLRTSANAHPEYGILGPVIAFMDEPDKIMTDGCEFNHPGRDGFFQRKEVPPAEPPPVVEVEIVNGCAMLVKADVFREVGLIDDRFFLIHEESDFCLRAQAACFRCGVVGATLVWHKGSSSFERSGRKLQRYYDARNLYLLLNKHAATHHQGRGRWSSITRYVRYVYHRYCHEREAGNREAADAVINGFCDALAGNYGPLNGQPHRGSGLVRKVFETAHRLH